MCLQPYANAGNAIHIAGAAVSDVVVMRNVSTDAALRLDGVHVGVMTRPGLIQLPLPLLDSLAYPRAADGLVHQCAWCRRVLDRAGRFRIWAQALRGDVSHGLCSTCAPLLRPIR